MALVPGLRPTRLHGRLAMLLAVVLVLAQTLGWMHRAWQDHGGPHDHLAKAESALGGEPIAQESWVAALFDHDAGAAECRLFDAAGQPGFPLAACVMLPIPVPGGAVARTHGDFVARWTALFDARGPPDLR